ncbi:TetR/AcrR family transcriptional regulator [Sphingomonas solaris]|uniref:TetR/AcrR family transcriptional regulator n=1 Tax=Alterirhizorhabdus solaris TaxID=2529389 RepID=A0A558R980_9SPHN|nr:TetR/AcrR family transcriptional regulator [Sphingomonas solaris]TVV75953.1 TetR/AcrR family transcriptional regulator [Sphingomonas solaris]
MWKANVARPKNTQIVDRMIDLAEQLFGERGIDAVPLQQISLRAGSRNRTAIQYHFGDADGLIREILQRRMPIIDRVRGRLLDTIGSGKEFSASALMHVLYVPMIDFLDKQGVRTHARFMLALLNSSRAYLSHDLFQNLQPNAFKAITLLVEATGIPEPLLLERQRLVAIMVLTSVFNRLPHLSSTEWDSALIENALAMATAAIGAPTDPDVITKLSVDPPETPGASTHQ